MFFKKNHQWRFKKYFAFPWIIVAIKPHTFVCTSLKTYFAQEPLFKGIDVWWYLPYTHSSQKLKSWFPQISMPSPMLFLSMVIKVYIETCMNL